jgi:hypothetical protein
MSTTTWNTEVCGLADVRNDPNGVTLTATPGSMLAEKSIPLAPTSVDPAGVPMASAEQVMTLQSDGNFVVEGSRECCPDGSADAAIRDIGGKKGRNTLEYRPVFALEFCLFTDLLDLLMLRHVLSTSRTKYSSSMGKRSSSTTTLTSVLRRPQGGI